MHGWRRILGQHVDIVALDTTPYDGYVAAGVVLTAEPPKHDIPHAGRIVGVLFLENTPHGGRGGEHGVITFRVTCWGDAIA